jgi:RHS repeat-associated protein
VTDNYAHNGDGLRRSRTIGATTTTFAWGNATGMPVILRDSAGNRYLYGLDLISVSDSSNKKFYYHTDGLGSTTAMTNSTGAVQDAYQYDVYGAIRAQTGTQANELTFTGEQVDTSGLEYLRARYYDPALGRFLGRDRLPVGNRYAYVDANPVNLVDPYGLWPCPGCGKIRSVATEISSDVVAVAKTVAHGTVDVVSRFATLDCLDAALGLTALTATAFLPELAPEISLGYKLAHAGLISYNAAAFGVSAGISAGRINRKEGASFENFASGAGFATSTAAALAGPLNYSQQLRGISDVTGYVATGLSTVQCVQNAIG